MWLQYQHDQRPMLRMVCYCKADAGCSRVQGLGDAALTGVSRRCGCQPSTEVGEVVSHLLYTVKNMKPSSFNIEFWGELGVRQKIIN